MAQEKSQLRTSTSPKDSTPSQPSMISESLLSYPAPSLAPDEVPQTAPVQPRQLLKDRLYVGNLHPTVDEYTLLQVFSKFGKISKLDFLFHKSGPLKGKPRGYAFVEYADADDATKALVSANDKLLRGRKLVVTHAQQAPLDDSHGFSKSRRGYSDLGKPTTLSLLKSAGSSSRSDARTEDKIAKMEAKLKQMEQSNPAGSRAHPSLPPKPVGIQTRAASGLTAGHSAAPAHRSKNSSKMVPLPSLPIVNPSSSASSSKPSGSAQPQKTTSHRRGGLSLAGVKIVKPKNP
ncbi:hypothetical protein NLI96_g3637 [Meripilus lineatus]|uniref:Probable RNA-binding protein 18 n=1 Tax=Meripilus lineatus TaxID=2056292 RepID=A0AAD5YGE5_9APHY|nr:hypothetical protein NLI96_g3637 [Physisporinus lineatus]